MAGRCNLNDEANNLELYSPGTRFTKYIDMFPLEARQWAEANKLQPADRDHGLVFEPGTLGTHIVDIQARKCTC